MPGWQPGGWSVGTGVDMRGVSAGGAGDGFQWGDLGVAALGGLQGFLQSGSPYGAAAGAVQGFLGAVSGGATMGGTVGGVPVVKSWQGGRMGLTADGRGVALRKNGTVKIFRYQKPIVVTRNPRVGTLLRADKRLTRLTHGLRRTVNRGRPRVTVHRKGRK